jgi:hypothetical protein
LSRTLQNDTLFKIDRVKNINDKTVVRDESSNNSAISWRPFVVVAEAWIPGENQQPWASNW